MTYIRTQLHQEIKIDAIITLHYFEYMKDFAFRGEAHDFWEFLYVDKGCVSVGNGERWLTLNTGDIIFHKPNEFHAIKSIGKSSPNLITGSFLTRSPAILFFEDKTFTLLAEERRIVSQLIAEARNAFSTPIHVPSIEKVELRENAPFASQQLVLLYLELFLITLYRNHSESTPMEADSPAPGRKETVKPLNKSISREGLFRDIQQYMEFHICESLTVSQICDAFSISRSALHALFHEALGIGVIDHFNRMKIKRAKEIIRDGNMNLTEIAYFLSYSSLPYFSKQFKKVTGMSPLQYATSIKGISELLRPQPKDTP